MKEQIINILNAHGKDWHFDDMRIKLSPHTPPMVIKAIIKRNQEWIMEWDSAEINLNEVESKETLATIYQRLAILIIKTNAS